MNRLKLAGAAIALGLMVSPAMASKTLEAIKKKGEVSCGVNTGLGGFGIADSSGKWTGFDVDFCRAVAAAALGDAN